VGDRETVAVDVDEETVMVEVAVDAEVVVDAAMSPLSSPPHAAAATLTTRTIAHVTMRHRRLLTAT
jgi:hypothetical protein